MHPILQRPWDYACEPFQITDHVYYVGNTWVGTYLLDSGEGLILIDCGMPQTVYQIFEAVRKLGFDPHDIRLLLISHGHYDHAGGAEAIRRYTGAKLRLGKEDVPFIGHPNLLLSDVIHCPDFQVDEVYGDEPVRFGRFEINAIHTPGHTPGARSFFFEDEVDGKKELCGMHGGIGFATMKREFLTKNGLPFSLRRKFHDGLIRLLDIPVTVALGSHPSHLHLLERYAARVPGKNAFVDATLWPEFIRSKISAFEQECLYPSLDDLA